MSFWIIIIANSPCKFIIIVVVLLGTRTTMQIYYFYSKFEFKSNCDIVPFNEVVLFQHVRNMWFTLDALLNIFLYIFMGENTLRVNHFSPKKWCIMSIVICNKLKSWWYSLAIKNKSKFLKNFMTTFWNSKFTLSQN